MNIFKRIKDNLQERQRLRDKVKVLETKLVKAQENINKTNAHYKRILRNKH